MTGLVEDKVALVTGAASGIGRASAQAFAREGARVAVADIDVAGGEETVRLIEKAGGEASLFPADLTMATEVERVVSGIVQRWGRLDCAHNNAGIAGEMGPTAACSEDNWDRVMAINLRSVWLCVKFELLQMTTQPSGGAIVNQSAVAGLVGNPGLPAYAVSKHGVLGLTKNAAVEYARPGIRVNAVCPGPILTPMMEGFIGHDNAALAHIAATQPGGRIGRPEEIAEAVVWLCSDRASFVSGAALVLDLGASQLGILPYADVAI
jgi:NAD(P)-dependent dehydrogenase (short-subunit alcohol dehydrogenase family)